jgi:hypothetical protein
MKVLKYFENLLLTQEKQIPRSAEGSSRRKRSRGGARDECLSAAWIFWPLEIAVSVIRRPRGSYCFIPKPDCLSLNNKTSVGAVRGRGAGILAYSSPNISRTWL